MKLVQIQCDCDNGECFDGDKWVECEICKGSGVLEVISLADEEQDEAES